MKIVINTCFGGFGISDIGKVEYENRSGIIVLNSGWDISRTDPILIAMVEEDSGLYSGGYASLKVVEIPDDIEWYIHDYDGQEHVLMTLIGATPSNHLKNLQKEASM